jgi:hypothetical protein
MGLPIGFGSPRQGADAQIGPIWLHQSRDDHHIVLLGCLLVVDGACRDPPIASDVVLLLL